LSDTLYFATNLFLGETYYLLSQADSSIYFLQNAEKLLSKNPSRTESSRLFNSLGVTYFESGNYTQSINYFNKAKNLTVGDKSFDDLEPYYQYALFSFLNNIGSSLLQLNQLDSALSIYRDLEQSGLNKDQVNTQLASIYLEKAIPDTALFYLDKIESAEYRQSASFQNQLAEIYMMQNDSKKAKNILESFVEATIKKDGFAKDYRLGRSYRLLGKIAFDEGDYEEALGYFQAAIIHIDGFFDQKDVFTNPEDFSLGFATFSLIESLVDKARSFIKLYQENNDPRFLEAGITTFQTAFDMAFYVSNYYDNDEARIFLGDFVLDTFQDAVEILLGQFQKSNDSQYLH
ncbi:MAG: tetratricopeptide repeat protein, partial [Cyclobacteriaceae bacterium]|nr:tetratricopeptide repeat protein [Cyclobacteriaceae bacterium]